MSERASEACIFITRSFFLFGVRTQNQILNLKALSENTSTRPLHFLLRFWQQAKQKWRNSSSSLLLVFTTIKKAFFSFHFLVKDCYLSFSSTGVPPGISFWFLLFLFFSFQKQVLQSQFLSRLGKQNSGLFSVCFHL